MWLSCDLNKTQKAKQIKIKLKFPSTNTKQFKTPLITPGGKPYLIRFDRSLTFKNVATMITIEKNSCHTRLVNNNAPARYMYQSYASKNQCQFICNRVTIMVDAISFFLFAFVA